LDPYITFKIILAVFLFVLSSFFSCSEAALFSLTPLHRHKMKEERFPFLDYVENLLNYPRRLLITIIVGNEALNIALSAFVTAIFVNVFGEGGRWVAIAVMAPVLLLFAESIPKTLGKIYSMRLSDFLSPFLTVFYRIEYPLVWVLEKISGVLIGPLKSTDGERQRVLMEDEFRTLVDVGHEEGVLDLSQRDLIHRVFELGDIEVSDIMTPRVDMFCLSLSMTLQEMKKEIVIHGYSRIPVYGRDRDDIQGIFYARDLIDSFSEEGQDSRIEALLKKPYFIPLERRAASLLRDFQVRKMHMAIVVDEYGGVAGLVTMEDILESIFGDIYDERDTREMSYRRIDENTMVVSGMMSIDEFNGLIGTAFSTEEFDTVGGLVFHLIGKLPVKGEEVMFNGCRLRVEKVRRARILRVRVTKEEKGNDR
jgi:putative hemolysin